MYFSAHRVSVLLEASQKALFLGETSSLGNSGLFSLRKADQVPLKLTRQVTDKSHGCLGLGRENLSTLGLISTLPHQGQSWIWAAHRMPVALCVQSGSMMSKAPRLICLTPFHGWNRDSGLKGPSQIS